ncbi:hypothetical protein [Thalassotalea piscium]|uniref:Uncharacterized protein n=1 Tax=Thalassotalea piscium TaxID=1230533 RepID=A0A7X0TTB4_9GAMM|nr:hypothetical protein [Thalassotalea piscium]MBB6543046.1 hypothetical protein [Thalassotalea piscium]
MLELCGIIILVLLVALICVKGISIQHQNEAMIWKEKFRKLELEHQKAYSDLKLSDNLYRQASSSLEREMLKQRVSKAYEEEFNAMGKNICTTAKSQEKINKLSVENGIKPSKHQKVNLSDSSMNALMTN